MSRMSDGSHQRIRASTLGCQPWRNSTGTQTAEGKQKSSQKDRLVRRPPKPRSIVEKEIAAIYELAEIMSQYHDLNELRARLAAEMSGNSLRSDRAKESHL